MAEIKVRDLTDTSSVTLDNKLMVLTSSTTNKVQNITIEDYITNLISTKANNVLTKGDDNKLYVETPESITGELSDLTTTDKTTLVNAINEVKGDAGDLADLSNLTETGEERLHALKAYSDKGELLYDAEGLEDVKGYAHSTFDLSKFTVVGSPVITSDGIASGFSSSNWLTAITVDITKPFDFYISIKSGSSTSGYQDIIDARGSNSEGFVFRAYNGVITLSTTDGVTSSNLTINPNTNYSFKVSYNGSNKMYVYNGSTEIINKTVTAFTISQLIYLGVRKTGSGNNAFSGSIDLKQFSITVDGVPVFSGNKTGIDTIKPDDYTVVGTPTISADGILSNCSIDDHLTATSIDLTNANEVILETVYTAPTSAPGTDATNTCLRCGTMAVGSRTTTSTLSLRAMIPGLYSYQDVLVNLPYDGSTYVLQGVFTGLKTASPSYYCRARKITDTAWAQSVGEVKTALAGQTTADVKIGFYSSSFVYALVNGKSDLNRNKIYINGSLVYQPCLKIPYTLSKTGSKVVNSVYRDRVNDMAEQFGSAPYYTLQEDNVPNYTVVGSPTISGDFVASGFSGSNYLTLPVMASDIKLGTTVYLSFTTNSVSTQQWLIDYTTLQGVALEIINSKLRIRYYKTSSSYDTPAGTNDLQDNTTYIARLEYYKVDTTYKVDVYLSSDNGATWVKEIAHTSSSALYTTNVNMTLGAASGTSAPNLGSIPLQSFKIYTNNKLTYQAVIDPCFTLPQGELYGLIEKTKGNLSVPAYGNQDIGVTISSDTFTYTCPDDGYIYCNNIQVSAGGTFELSISRNGQSSYLILFGGASVDSSVQIPFIYPVKKGDVVQTLWSSAASTYPTLYFVPKEGV